MYIVNEKKADGLCSFVYSLMHDYSIIDVWEYIHLRNVIRFLTPDGNKYWVYWFGEANNWEKRISYLKDLAGYEK